MSAFVKRYWFRLCIVKEGWIIRICQAENPDEAKKIFGTVARHCLTHQLLWIELCELTGCIIPRTAKPTDLAEGNIMIRVKGKLIIFWTPLTFR